MPSKSEIEFCERWLDLRGPDGEVWGGEYLHPSFAGAPAVAVLLVREDLPTLWNLTPRGADLVASYESAVDQEMEIVPDKTTAYEPPRDWPKPAEPCPDCDEGFIYIDMGAIPGSTSSSARRLWPATCPTCKGEKVVEAEAVRDIGRPLEGLGEILDGQREAWIAGTCPALDDGWQPLTLEFAATLTGKRIEAKVGGDTPVDPDRHDQRIVARGISPCAKWLRVDFTEAGRDRAGVLALRSGSGYPLGGGWSVRVVDPAALGVIDDGWRQLTRVAGQALAGKPFEARRDADDPPRHHVAELEQSGLEQPGHGHLRLIGGGTMLFDGSWLVRDAVVDQG